MVGPRQIIDISVDGIVYSLVSAAETTKVDCTILQCVLQELRNVLHYHALCLLQGLCKPLHYHELWVLQGPRYWVPSRVHTRRQRMPLPCTVCVAGTTLQGSVACSYEVTARAILARATWRPVVSRSWHSATTKHWDTQRVSGRRSFPCNATHIYVHGHSICFLPYPQ